MWVGLELTIYGMGLVFLLLGLLWAMVSLLTRLDAQEPIGEPAAHVAGPASIEPALLAAIVIACRAHRITRRKQAAPELRTHEPGSLPSRWVGSGRTRQNRSWAPGGRYS
jgi:Na+-transporting methylmalonyl-CoA/oxaloacetate decarboxylase gamma subunit